MSRFQIQMASCVWCCLAVSAAVAGDSETVVLNINGDEPVVLTLAEEGESPEPQLLLIGCLPPADLCPVDCYGTAAAGSCPCPHCSYDGCKHDGTCRDRRKFRKYVRHLHSTCDLYPHYAYAPEHHGYYYFRPYNYTHILEDQQESIRLGGDPGNPYSVSMFIPLHAAFAETEPAQPDGYEQVRPQRQALPLLEDLLNK